MLGALRHGAGPDTQTDGSPLRAEPLPVAVLAQQHKLAALLIVDKRMGTMLNVPRTAILTDVACELLGRIRRFFHEPPNRSWLPPVAVRSAAAELMRLRRDVQTIARGQLGAGRDARYHPASDPGGASSERASEVRVRHRQLRLPDAIVLACA